MAQAGSFGSLFGVELGSHKGPKDTLADRQVGRKVEGPALS